MMRAKSLGSNRPNARENINKYAFLTKHKAFGIHLLRRHNLAIGRGDIPPPKPKLLKFKGLGSKKEMKRHVDYVLCVCVLLLLNQHILLKLAIP
jgi:hypothetical protein